MAAKRIEWIDFAKGITMLFVIIGHTIGGGMRGLIFSFHMPLFFILSSMTFRFSTTTDTFLKNTARAVRHLLIPVLIIWSLRFIQYFIADHIQIANIGSYFVDRLLMLFWGSGVELEVGTRTLQPLGMPWFLLVLCFGRILYDFIQMHFKGAELYFLVAVVSIVGVVLGSIQWLPFSMDIAFAVLPLFCYGQKFSKEKIQGNFLRVTCYFTLWAILFVICYLIGGTYLELADRRYPAFPICYIAAIFGTLMICEFGAYIKDKVGKMYEGLCYVGRCSIYLFGVHCMDKIWQPLWSHTGNQYVKSVVRVGLDLLVFYLLIRCITAVKAKSK